jgi:hypothetical protein
LTEGDHLENGVQLVHWLSPLEPRLDKATTIKAFVKLVARILVLEPGEAYCIQDVERGGYILARSSTSAHEDGDNDEDRAFNFINCPDDYDVPTDFSIGDGKVRLTIRGTENPRCRDSCG